MLAKQNRLTKARIAYILKKGKTTFNRYFTAKTMDSRTGESRFCVIINKKLIAKAVQRNNLRRRILTAIRLIMKTSPSKKDIVLIIKSDTIPLNFEELKKEIGNTLPKL